MSSGLRLSSTAKDNQENDVFSKPPLAQKRLSSQTSQRPALAARAVNTNPNANHSLISKPDRNKNGGLLHSAVGGQAPLLAKRSLESARLASRTGSFRVNPNSGNIDFSNDHKASTHISNKLISKQTENTFAPRKKVSRGSAFYPRPSVPLDWADLPIDHVPVGPPDLDDEIVVQVSPEKIDPRDLVPDLVPPEVMERAVLALQMGLDDFPDLEVDLSDTSFEHEV